MYVKKYGLQYKKHITHNMDFYYMGRANQLLSAHPSIYYIETFTLRFYKI